MIYKDYRRNHVILPGRDEALERFLGQEYKGLHHKQRNAVSSNSEDALTWSCFDILSSHPAVDRASALDEILEDSFEGQSPLSFRQRGIPSHDITIHVGKTYAGLTTKEATEVDASVEAPGILVFIEAKLYSAASPASPPEKPHDQIARKLRVGLDSIQNSSLDFFFIVLDVAPVKMMYEKRPKQEAIEGRSGGYASKWRTAWMYQYYKRGSNGSLRPLKSALEGVCREKVALTCG